MDTSEQYIKMCRMTSKIQELQLVSIQNDSTLDAHSYLFDTVLNEVIRYSSNKDHRHWLLNWREEAWLERFVWLPRQDQLQSVLMKSRIGDDTYNITQMSIEFLSFANRPTELLSLEQLWLAFVMKDLYNSVWNGEDWRLSDGHQ